MKFQSPRRRSEISMESDYACWLMMYFDVKEGGLDFRHFRSRQSIRMVECGERRNLRSHYFPTASCQTSIYTYIIHR